MNDIGSTDRWLSGISNLGNQVFVCNLPLSHILYKLQFIYMVTLQLRFFLCFFVAFISTLLLSDFVVVELRITRSFFKIGIYKKTLKPKKSKMHISTNKC